MKRINKLGLDGIEVWAEHLWRTGENASELQALADSLELHRTVHGPSWDLNLCSIDRQMLVASRRCTLNAVDLANDLGAPVVVVHPGHRSLGGHFQKYHWEELLRSYSEICSYAAEKNVRIGLEAMENIPKEFLCDAPSVNRFVKELRSQGVQNLGVTVDLAHVTTVSSDVMRYIGQYRTVVEIHISNVESSKLHMPLSDGELDFTRLLPQLVERFEGPIVIEGISVDPDFSLLDGNACTVRRIIK